MNNVAEALQQLKEAINKDKQGRAKRAWKNGVLFAILSLEDGKDIQYLKDYINGNQPIQK